jgi:hypothetical protein
MEYVIVTYPTQRSVYVDGELMGDTNEVLRMDSGTHRFDLGSPADCEPIFFEVAVKETSALLPMKIVFIEKLQV